MNVPAGAAFFSFMPSAFLTSHVYVISSHYIRFVYGEFLGTVEEQA